MQASDVISMAHGSGGIMSNELIHECFLDSYIDKDLYLGDDATVLNNFKLNPGQRICMSTDSFVVDPLFFAGGDIGKLAVCGTVNDISTSGAKCVALSLSFIIEEGFALCDLKKICKSIALCSEEAGVSIVTGDTKVVEKGKCDGLYINSTGIGIIDSNVDCSGTNIKDEDVVLLSGCIGDHAISILSQRKQLNFSSDLQSDCAPLNSLVADILKVCPNVSAFRDPTRGGIASALNEFAAQCDCDITINEVEVPVKKSVKSACDMLGFDVFHLANEGKMLCIVPPEYADDVLSVMRNNKYGKEAAIIGYVSKKSDENPKVYVQTEYHTKRILDMLVGQQLPRIC